MKYFKIILIFFLFLLNKTSFADENIVEILKKGGNIIFIRHAFAPGNGDPQILIFRIVPLKETSAKMVNYKH